MRKTTVVLALLLGAAAYGAERPSLSLEEVMDSLGASCKLPLEAERMGSLTPAPGAQTVLKLLGEGEDLTGHRRPLLEGEDRATFLRLYREEEKRVAQSKNRTDRIRLLGLYRSLATQDTGEKSDKKIFYLLRALSLTSRKERREVEECFRALRHLFHSSTLPHVLAFCSAAQRYLECAARDPVERSILEDMLSRAWCKAAVLLARAGSFKAAVEAVRAAASYAPRSFKATAEFLNETFARRSELLGEVTELTQAASRSPEAARRWSILLLGTFRQPEEALLAMRDSGHSTLKGLATLLETQGGTKAAAEVVRDMAQQFEEPEKTGLLLLALQLYERAGGRTDLPQAKKLRLELHGAVDPRLALRLDPEGSYAGISIRVLTDPPGSYVYINGALQGVTGSLIRTPCTVCGVTPGSHTITAVRLGFRDVSLRPRMLRHGSIVAGRHRQGRSRLLARAGKNLFLGKRFPLKGVLSGGECLFDGEVRPLSRRSGFATADWPCTFTVILPRPLRLSALRMKLWDGDKRTYKYMIDLSPDGRRFFRAVDRSEEGGSSWQNLLFPLQRIRVIRIHGLHNSAGNSKFHVLELEGYEIVTPELMQKPLCWR